MPHHLIELQQTKDHITVDGAHMIAACAGYRLLPLSQITVVFIGEEQTELIFVNGFLVRPVPNLLCVSPGINTALGHSHRVIVDEVHCEFMDHALIPSFSKLIECCLLSCANRFSRRRLDASA